MRSPFVARFAGLLVMPLLALACGSSAPPEAAPGAPIDPPRRNADLDMMMNATPDPVPAVTAAPEATAAASASAPPSASAAPSAAPKKPAKP